MIRDWFDNKAAVAFAKEIARDLNRLHPVASGNTNASKKDRKKIDSVIVRVDAFAQQHKLNVYKKAKLLNTVKWELRDAGQDDTFVDDVVSSLAFRLK